MIAALAVAAGWLLFASLVVVLGSLAARWVYVPRTASSLPEAEDALTRSAARLGSIGAFFLPVAMAGLFARQLAEFRDPFATWTEDAQLLLSTQWGTTWRWSAALAVVVALLFLLVRLELRWAWWPAAAGALALSFYPALTGHAAGTEGLRVLTIGADFVHVVAAGVWVGGLTYVLWAERSWRKTAEEPGSVLPALVPAFSPVAVGAVATLVVTGTIAAWIHVASFAALFQSTYGRLLLAKVGAVLLVMYLGAVNWRRLSPQLGSEEGQDALRRNAATELLIMQVVLVVTAVLVRTSPMAH